MPRALEFDQGVADSLCEQLMLGRSVRSICDSDDMPAMSTIFKWLNKVPSFAEQYARARETQADTLFDEIQDIADDSRNDWMERQDDDDKSSWVINGEAIQRARLRVDARKWMAGKLRPKKYGDKIEAEVSGSLIVQVVKLAHDPDPSE